MKKKEANIVIVVVAVALLVIAIYAILRKGK